MSKLQPYFLLHLCYLLQEKLLFHSLRTFDNLPKYHHHLILINNNFDLYIQQNAADKAENERKAAEREEQERIRAAREDEYGRRRYGSIIPGQRYIDE